MKGVWEVEMAAGDKQFDTIFVMAGTIDQALTEATKVHHGNQEKKPLIFWDATSVKIRLIAEVSNNVLLG